MMGTFHYAVDENAPSKQAWKINVGGELLSGHNFEVHCGCKSKNPKRSIKFSDTGLSLDVTAAPNYVPPDPSTVIVKKKNPPAARSEPKKKPEPKPRPEPVWYLLTLTE